MRNYTARITSTVKGKISECGGRSLWMTFQIRHGEGVYKLSVQIYDAALFVLLPATYFFPKLPRSLKNTFVALRPLKSKSYYCDSFK